MFLAYDEGLSKVNQKFTNIFCWNEVDRMGETAQLYFEYYFVC